MGVVFHNDGRHSNASPARSKNTMCYQNSPSSSVVKWNFSFCSSDTSFHSSDLQHQSSAQLLHTKPKASQNTVHQSTIEPKHPRECIFAITMSIYLFSCARGMVNNPFSYTPTKSFTRKNPGTENFTREELSVCSAESAASCFYYAK